MSGNGKVIGQRILLAVGVLGVSIALDQWTKAIATRYLTGRGVLSYLNDTVRLELAKNQGAFLSLGAGMSPQARSLVFTFGVGIVLAFLLYAALVQPKMSTPLRVSYLLMVSGGLSNGFDRVVAGGKVTDFMNLGLGGLRTGIFNVADLAIVAGVVVMLLAGRGAEKAQPSKA